LRQSKRALFGEGGTEVRIAPLLECRPLSGEKIQWYLAAELRDRIRQAGVKITVIDRLAGKQYAVAPPVVRRLVAAQAARRTHTLRVASPQFSNRYRMNGLIPICGPTPLLTEDGDSRLPLVYFMVASLYKHALDSLLPVDNWLNGHRMLDE
jgi:hypothetical protein